MTTALRLSDDLVRSAEAGGRTLKRSPPKQIEYWAEIGMAVARLASQNESLALVQGFARVRIEPLPSLPVDPEDVFAEVEEQSTKGTLSGVVTGAASIYEASRSRPGMLDCIHPDGRRETGYFRDGRFIPCANSTMV